MGCISSKHITNSSISPLHEYSLALSFDPTALGDLEYNRDYELLENTRDDTEDDAKISNHEDTSTKRSKVVVEDESLESSCYNPNSDHSKKPALTLNARIGRSTVAEHVAAGWPAWLSAVAGEAIDGWLPQKTESYERLEKIGQGTYSSVYRARDLRTGRMMALKKVRFDNFQPESVRFMAREITILRRLDHPNIMKLEGIVTSRLSCSVYLVFEYMEHDLAGLLSSPNIRFSDSQIKCYMRQLLKGIEHCHSRGILHRDIKTANILVNNEGQLKIADFGLANFIASRQPLTSRVVTMWYRPPELLLGSTNYGSYVDMWSAGCVFAELLIGRPILKGRTEVEQLHKIFMLCGNPPEEYWTKMTLPHATMFKPQYAYESSLRERFKELPKSAVNLIATLLSVDPDMRGSATSALQSKYFRTKPFACDPASLPKYPPCKEMDAKYREEAHRKRAGGKFRSSGTSKNQRRGRKVLQEQTTLNNVNLTEVPRSAYLNGESRGLGGYNRGPSKAAFDTMSDLSQTMEVSQTDTMRSLPAQTSMSKRRKHVSFVTPTSQDVRPIEPIHDQDTTMAENEEFRSKVQSGFRRVTQTMHKQQTFGPSDSSEVYETQDLSYGHHEEERLQYSGPMLIRSRRSNGRHESYAHTGVQKSRFSRDADL